MTQADGAMVRRPVSVPRINKPFCADGEAIVAIGVSDAQDLARHAFTLRLPAI